MDARSSRAGGRVRAVLALPVSFVLLLAGSGAHAAQRVRDLGDTDRFMVDEPAAAAPAQVPFDQPKVDIFAPALRAAGSISYDAEGVPTVLAANDLDAAYMLGYAHARDRFFQMDFFRRTASGTLAELVGAPALANDVQLRTLGLARAAFASWQAYPDELRGILKAYADGVNFWLATNPLPPEYGALELTRAAPWSPVDSIALGKLLAFQLSFDLDTDFSIKLGAYQQAGAAGGFNGTALFFEDTHRSAPPDNRISIPGFTPTGAAEIKVSNDARLTTEAMPQVSPETMALAQAYQDKIKNNPIIGPTLSRRNGRGGSNWWIVSGANTQSGRPILANDPHLGLDTPTIFQEVHIVSTGGGINVVGASFPGTPAVLLGCTERFCWGLTVNPLDVTDVYQEQFVVNTYGLPTHTIYRGNFEPVVLVFQSFFVNRLNGVPDDPVRDNSIGYLNGAITVLVPRRNMGPVLQITGSSGISAQYTGWGPTFELEAIRRINKARNLDEFRSAISFFDVGSQNFSYADVDGNIAYFTSAEMPIRDDLQNLMAPDGAPPYIVRDGTGARRNEWLPVTTPIPNQAVPFQVLPPSQMPFVINPAQGYIANANNDPIGTTLDNNPLNQVRPGGGLYYLNVGYASYRIGRIDRMLQSAIQSGRKLRVSEIQAMQANNQGLDAELVLPHLLAANRNANVDGAWANLAAIGDDPRVVEAISRLSAWNLTSPTGIPQGYDPPALPEFLPPPGQDVGSSSVAATLFATWRGQVIRNTIDATMTRIGVGNFLPSGDIPYTALKNLLDTFPQRRGTGVSGVNFFAVQGAPNPEAARDFLLLKSLQDALTLLASDGFAPAFNRSTNQDDYRWGRLHRIVFDHPLGGPFNLPDANATYGFANVSPQLLGVARPGGYEVVDDSDHSVRANSVNGFMFTNGPARRFVGEMTSPATMRQILPGGQSGVLGSPRYASQLGRWLTNQYKPLVIDVTQSTTNPVTRLDFIPR